MERVVLRPKQRSERLRVELARDRVELTRDRVELAVEGMELVSSTK